MWPGTIAQPSFHLYQPLVSRDGWNILFRVIATGNMALSWSGPFHIIYLGPSSDFDGFTNPSELLIVILNVKNENSFPMIDF